MMIVGSNAGAKVRTGWAETRVPWKPLVTPCVQHRSGVLMLGSHLAAGKPPYKSCCRELSVLTHDDKSCLFGAGLTDTALFTPAAPWGGLCAGGVGQGQCLEAAGLGWVGAAWLVIDHFCWWHRAGPDHPADVQPGKAKSTG